MIMQYEFIFSMVYFWVYPKAIYVMILFLKLIKVDTSHCGIRALGRSIGLELVQLKEFMKYFIDYDPLFLLC